ncbi:MAG TPA: efflux RND transporter periplasmic adaptor subunit [Pyrinomonadaceae bacterium]
MSSLQDRRRPRLLALKFFSLLVVCGLLSACSSKAPAPQPKPVRTSSVEVLANNSTLRYSGSIGPTTQLELAFKVGGYVSGIEQVRGVDGQLRYLQGGDVVKKGSPLAIIRQGDYQVKVNEAQSQVNEARAGIEAAKNQRAQAESAVNTALAQLSEAEAAFARAKLDYERARTLINSQSITKTEFDAAKAQYEVAEARVAAAKAQVNTAKAAAKVAASQVAAMEAKSRSAGEVVNEAKIPLGDTVLRAPMDCTILKREVEVGTLVAPGKAGFLIADLRTVKAVFGVPDRGVQNLHLGMPLKVTTEAVPDREFAGQVTAVSPAADVKSRVFDIEITMPNGDNLLKSGMIATIEVEAGPVPVDVLVVPVNAVIQSKENPGGYAVFVVENQNGKLVAKQRNVKLGDAYGNTVAVTEGVRKGDQVITTGVTMVLDGDVVQVVP